MAERDIRSDMTTSIEEQMARMKQKSTIAAMSYYRDIALGMYDPKRLADPGPLIGTFCNLVPEELILAAGARPFRLCAGYQGTISVSERILPQVFCPLIKSSVGLFMSEVLDEVEMIVVPTTCDGKKKAAEILSEKKRTLIMELPHTIVSPQARGLWLTEVRTLKRNLERYLGKRIAKKNLKQAIGKTNRKRALLGELYELRKKTPPIWGSDALLVTHTSFYADPDTWIAQTEALLSELKDKEPVVGEQNPRIMLTGSPIILPTWKIPFLIEEAGGIIVMDDLCSAAKTLLDKIEVRAWTMYDMLIGLADHYLMSACPCFVPNDPRITKVSNYVKDYSIDGVVYHNLQGCQLYGGEVWRMERTLKEKGIPVLKLETSYGEGDIKQLKIRVDAFLEMLEAGIEP
ncbi:MAG: 2-hydroxyacyl-CoA dehydratase [Thermoplasmata archaeon]|nr:MAG: 2-hydroxyacyl-CoA dehydratase [Thermoplasmata archaeon]